MTRKKMIEEQLKPRGIIDPKVLKVLSEIHREDFFPEGIKDRAYDDGAFPIGHRQTISQPFIVAYMTQKLCLKPDDKVLEIGTGSGYQAAILSKLVKSVYSIEIVEELLFNAKSVFYQKDFHNIKTKLGDGFDGWEEEAPYNAIILTAAPKSVPKKLLSQLAVGGRLIAPVGEFEQDLILYKKNEDKIEQQKLIPVRFVPMTGKSLG